jgi:single-stranded-DNA-specific exonuclease
VFVAAGLPRLLATPRPGLAALCQATKTTRAEPEHVLRQLVPRLNACGRMGEARAIWQLLRLQPEGAVASWLQEAAAAHASTRALYRDTMADAQAQVHRMHFRDQRVLVVARSGWHQGIMGPLAAQLAQQYGRPAIAIALDEERGVGSGRSAAGINLLELLRGCQETLMRFGGHAAACGLTVSRGQLETFRRLVNERAQPAHTLASQAAGVCADLELLLEQVRPEWVEQMPRLWPFGIGNPKPSVLLRQVQFKILSPRTGRLMQGQAECAARGPLEGLGETDWYDALVHPTIVTGQLQLALGDVRDAVAPWAPSQTSGSSYTPATF